jgi:hypothetical protein
MTLSVRQHFMCVQEDMGSNVQALRRMPSLQQLLLDVERFVSRQPLAEGQHVCELETMTTLTKLQLCISDGGFAGADGD